MIASSYKVLARKYRPQLFSDVLGQDVTIEILKNAIVHKKLSHALLLTGIRGVGKTTTARLIAKILCCDTPIDYVNACGSCKSCVAFSNDNHPDIIEMDAASHTGVDDVREIVESVLYAPIFGKYRVYIIDEVHMLSKNAFNALLKTLEEPPAHSKFIFATTERHKVPDTIVSRCLTLQLQPVQLSQIEENLKKICENESVQAQDEALSFIANLANGSIRDSLSILEKVISFLLSSKSHFLDIQLVQTVLGLPQDQVISTLCTAIEHKELLQAIEQTRIILNQNVEPLEIAKALLKKIHASLLGHLEEASSHISFKTLSIESKNRLWSVVQHSLKELHESPLPKESVEVMILRLCLLSNLPPLKELLKNTGDHSSTITSTHSVSQAIPPSNSTAFTTFKELVAWVEDKKEPHLSYFLRRDVRIHKFEPRYIECSLTKDSEQSLMRDLKTLLKNECNEDWTIDVISTPSTAPQTLYEQKLEKINVSKQLALNSDIMQHLLKKFPNTITTIQ